MVAQIKELRKGLKIQKLAAISAPINRTASVTRVISREADVLLFIINYFPLSGINTYHKNYRIFVPLIGSIQFNK
jgi:hypothetical protein